MKDIIILSLSFLFGLILGIIVTYDDAKQMYKHDNYEHGVMTIKGEWLPCFRLAKEEYEK